MAASPSVLRGEDALKGDAEVQHQIGLEIRMRLAPADVAYGARLQCRKIGGRGVYEGGTGRQQLAGRRCVRADGAGPLHEVNVLRHGLESDGDGFGACRFAERMLAL